MKIVGPYNAMYDKNGIPIASKVASYAGAINVSEIFIDFRDINYNPTSAAAITSYKILGYANSSNITTLNTDLHMRAMIDNSPITAATYDYIYNLSYSSAPNFAQLQNQVPIGTIKSNNKFWFSITVYPPFCTSSFGPVYETICNSVHPTASIRVLRKNSVTIRDTAYTGINGIYLYLDTGEFEQHTIEVYEVLGGL